MELAKQTMEDVTVDHTMEQAGDAQDHLDNHDEIEIDLDIAEDRDVDVVVDDASVAASDQPPSLAGGADAPHDADMLDEEYTEDHALRPEYTLHSEEQQQYVNDGEDHGDDTYEAEMEDDYEEDIDAPIPGTSALEPLHISREEVHLQALERPSPRDHESPASGNSETPAHQPPEGRIHESPEAKPEVEEGYQYDDHPTTGVDEVSYSTEYLEGGGAEGHNETHVDRAREPSAQDRVQGDADHTADEARKSVEPEGQHTDEDADAAADEAGAYVEDESGGQITKNALNLHNIKIIYQDNEISLFPPMEDDPTETYFLEDTGLAHEPIRQLFDACRLVLDDHISKDEELVLDVDCLGLHLSQSASQSSSTTLYQITEVYHVLCLNDGVNAPEPLYLSLSSTNTFDSLFKSLAQAVEAGNGLSSIDRWDGYEQYDMEDSTAFPEDEETDILDASGGYYAETHSTEPTEPQGVKHEAAEKTVEHAKAEVHHEHQKEDDGAAASDTASKANHHAETATLHGEEDTVSTTGHERGASAEDQSTNAGNIVDSGERSEDWEVDEVTAAGATHRAEGQDDLTRADYVELHETPQPEQQAYTTYNETTEEDDTHAKSAADRPDGSSEHVEELEEFDFEESEAPAPELRAQNTLQPLQGLHSAADAHPETVEAHIDDFTQPLESDVRQPELSFDETIIEASNDNSGPPDNIPRTTNGPPQDNSVAHPERGPGTPETAHSRFDIDEDIFRSPRPGSAAISLPEGEAAVDSTPGMPGNPSREADELSVVAPDGESYTTSADIEPGEVVQSEDPAFEVYYEKVFADESPIPAKRPPPDDDVSANEDAVPELKRHRSE